MYCTEVRFASFLSGGFTTMAVINQPERKLAKGISVYGLDRFLVSLTMTWNSEKRMIYYSCIHGFMPNLHKKS